MNIDALMRPLTGPNAPCGQDMMFSAEFDTIQNARRYDDPSLSQGEWITDIKEADWPQVIQVCEALLAERTKDIRVVVWLTEALCHSRGLDGLADGYTLLKQMCAAWWAELHPLPEDGDAAQRIGSLDWLLNRTETLIREIPLTESGKGRYSLQDLESARATASNMERNPGLAEELARKAHLTMAQFEAARKDTSGQVFIDTLAAVERAKAAIQAFKSVIDGLLAADAPGVGPVLDLLEDLDVLCRRYASEAGVRSGGAPKAVEPDAIAPIPSPPVSANQVLGPVKDRDDAIRQLNDIADFFKRTEPHSPVAYLAQKAARWGNMPLHEWLRAVLKDDAALSQMEDLLGVAPRADDVGDLNH